MRIEEYTRKLTGDGYIVTGGHKSWDDHNSAKCAPIKMSLPCYPGTDQPCYICDSLDELVQLIDSDMFLPGEYDEGVEDFRQNYVDIFKGFYPDWQLGAFKVFVGGIALYYGNIKTGAKGLLWIIGAKKLRLTFQAPRTRLGFEPIYNVWIKHDNGIHCKTQVEEDLGYVHREIDFTLTNPNKSDDDLFHWDNQTLKIIEYAGI